MTPRGKTTARLGKGKWPRQWERAKVVREGTATLTQVSRELGKRGTARRAQPVARAEGSRCRRRHRRDATSVGLLRDVR
jgi:hypothetical protein